jgi:tripartite-type tricarboxylate transporter receptor subunit TctC
MITSHKIASCDLFHIHNCALPDISAIGDFIPGFEASAWAGIGVPKNTPAEIVDKLYKEINACLADSTIKARLADLGSVSESGPLVRFGKPA